MYDWNDYTLRTAPKTFVTEVLFGDRLKTIFLWWRETRRQRMLFQGPVRLLLEGHATHVTPRVLASAGS
jgi:hypothetical protein